MKCSALSARQESSSLTERCPNAGSHAACQPATASAQRITAWPTQKRLSGGRCRITRIEDSEPPVLAEVRLDLRAEGQLAARHICDPTISVRCLWSRHPRGRTPLTV